MPQFYGSSLASLTGLPEAQGQPQIDTQTPETMVNDGLTILDESGKAAREGMGGPAMPSYQVKTDANGRSIYTISLSEDAFFKTQNMLQRGAQSESLVELAKVGKQAIDARTREIDRLKNTLETVEKYPIIAQLGRLASLAATAYIAPGSKGQALVHAAGAFGSSLLTQTPEILSARIAEAEQDKVKTLLPIAEQERRAADTEAQRLYQQRSLAQQDLQLKQQREIADQTNKARIMAPLETQAGQGEPPDKDSTIAKLRTGGWSEKDATAEYNNLASLATSARKRKDADFKAESERLERMQKESFRHAEEIAKIGRGEAAADRKLGISMQAVGAANDDMRVAQGNYIEGRQTIYDVYKATNPGKPVPDSPDQAVAEINAVLVGKDGSKAMANLGKQGIDTDKLGERLTKAAAGIKTYQVQGPELQARYNAAIQTLPPDLQKTFAPPAPKAAAPPPAPKPIAVPPQKKAPLSSIQVIEDASIEQFNAIYPKLRDAGYSQEELADMLERKKKQAATAAATGYVKRTFGPAAEAVTGTATDLFGAVRRAGGIITGP